MRIRLLTPLLALAVLGACSDGGDGDDSDDPSTGETRARTEVTAPPVPDPSPAGTGVAVVGGSPNPFSVTECRLEPGSEPGILVSVTGAGTTTSGVPFQVEVQRFAIDTTAAETFTDTITYSDTARIFQLQRVEVGGVVSDVRDPDARGTLLQVRPDGLAASGLAGPPGSGDGRDVGIVGFALDATCP